MRRPSLSSLKRAHDRSSQTLEQAFDPRSNSLNALRLIFATLVIVSHAWPLGGFGGDPVVGGMSVGIWAVSGFFVISGYLIAGSRLHSSFGAYMWRRFLRIFPGLWACLIVTVTLFVSIALFDEGKGIFSGLASRASYVGIKGLLVPGFAGIARTLANVPYANAWNGSLWTLPVEFICYIAIACLLSIALVRRNRAILIAVFLVASAIDMVAVELSFPIAAQDVVGLTTCFIAGSLLYVYRDRVLFNTSLGLLALAILLVAVVFAQAGAVVALPLAYLCLWLGVVLPLRSVGRANDFSYGVYIYAFPVAQLLAVFGATKLGVASCIGLTIALTYPLAVASWFAVERPAMRLKTMRLPRRRELVGDRSDITATAQRSKVRSEIPTR